MNLKAIKQKINKPYNQFNDIAISYKIKGQSEYNIAHYIVNEFGTLIDLPMNAWQGSKEVGEKQIDNMLKYALKLCYFKEIIIEDKKTRIRY